MEYWNIKNYYRVREEGIYETMGRDSIGVYLRGGE
jgi:hypothetical protein